MYVQWLLQTALQAEVASRSCKPEGGVVVVLMAEQEKPMQSEHIYQEKEPHCSGDYTKIGFDSEEAEHII